MQWFKNKIEKTYALFIFFSLFSSVTAFEVNVRSTGNKKIPLLVAIIAEPVRYEELHEIGAIVKNDFEFGQTV